MTTYSIPADGSVNANAAGPPSMAEDSELVARLKAGDDRAYEELVRTYAGRLLAVARRMLMSEHDSADAVQDAFLSAFRAIGSFQGESKLNTWLQRIVINACLMRKRSSSRRPVGSIEELLPRFDETGHHAHPIRAWSTPLDQLQRGEIRALVRSAIERLPESHRIVLLLRDIQELDTEETARILGTTCGAVKVRLHRARQALRTLLEPSFA